MREKTAGMRERAAQTPESALESYTSAFPEADLEALATHLAVAGVSSMFGLSIEARIQALGFDLSRPRYTIVRMLYLSPEHGMAQSDIAQALGVSGSNVTQLREFLEEAFAHGRIDFVDRKERAILSGEPRREQARFDALAAARRHARV